MGTVPGKGKTSNQNLRPTLPSNQSNTLPLPSKQEPPPAATVRPFTPEQKESTTFQKPQIVATSSIYSMYTKQQQGVPGAQNRLPNRFNFVSGE